MTLLREHRHGRRDHAQTILAYELNDARLPVNNGAPLRLRVERQLGYKQAKYIMRIELVESFDRSPAARAGTGKTRATSGTPGSDACAHTVTAIWLFAHVGLRRHRCAESTPHLRSWLVIRQSQPIVRDSVAAASNCLRIAS